MRAAITANDNTPADNAITDAGATLGRVLFYDKSLSKNNTISCASCHKPTENFADNSIFSTGFANGFTVRHSMPILNVRFYKSGKMFWDERAASLEKQALMPIQHPVEMGMTLAELEAAVKSKAYYPSLFQKAFGSTQIDSIKIAKALAQFERSIVTYQSKYDQVKQGLATFTPAEAQGEQLYLTAAPVGTNHTCAGCHTPPFFLTSTPVAPFGLNDANDQGINNTGRFKSGSLRNIMMRSNLFHNGSIASVQTMLTTATQVGPHKVAPQDVQLLVAFLNTLNDNTLATEKKFSDPFVQ